VRADLGTEGAQLGLHRAGALAPQLGELELCGGPVGDLLGGPGEARRALGGVGGQRPDDEVVDDEGGDDRGADRAVGIGAGDLAGTDDDGLTCLDDRGGVRGDVGGVVLAVADPGEVRVTPWMASAEAWSMSMRCRAARVEPSSVRPSRSGSAAIDTECSVS